MTDDVLRCDVAVIGAGTAGLAAERAARSSGATTLLIDPAFNGTTCARAGCMPSKLVIAASHAAHAARTTDQFGVRVGDVTLDGAAVTFTDPPLASIGQADGEGITATHANYSDQGRVRVDGVNHGLVTLYANVADGVLVLVYQGIPGNPDLWENLPERRYGHLETPRHDRLDYRMGHQEPGRNRGVSHLLRLPLKRTQFAWTDNALRWLSRKREHL